MSKAIGKYPDAVYRVSLKAIIRDDAGNILAVKEKSDNWSLPGGGIDHGESIEEALSRELYEEVLISKPFTYTYVGAESVYVEEQQAWMLWVIYEVKPEVGYDYGVGADSDEVGFIDVEILKNNTDRSGRLTYKWAKNIR